MPLHRGVELFMTIRRSRRQWSEGRVSRRRFLGDTHAQRVGFTVSYDLRSSQTSHHAGKTTIRALIRSRSRTSAVFEWKTGRRPISVVGMVFTVRMALPCTAVVVPMDRDPFRRGCGALTTTRCPEWTGQRYKQPTALVKRGTQIFYKLWKKRGSCVAPILRSGYVTLSASR